MPPIASITVLLALVLDLTLQEYPQRIHPVVAYGAVLEHVGEHWPVPRFSGALAAVLLPLLAGAATSGVVFIGQLVHPAAQVVIAGGLLFATTSLRMLVETANTVINLSGKDPDIAREHLPALVGRDPSELSAAEIRSAAVESAAENLSDGLVAPLTAFVVFAWSLPLAVGAAVWVKAVNTGDSMLGYPENEAGWGFARLDDIVMWLPARLTGLVIAIVARAPTTVIHVRHWAREPPSPNAGWPMATLATVLDVRLVKPDLYDLNPSAGLPSTDEAVMGVRVVKRAGLVAFIGAAVIAWY